MNRLRNRIATAWACIKPWSINSKNSSLEKGFKDDNGKIYAFYHIYCGPNNWQQIVRQQINAIEESGLMQRLDRLYLAIVGTPAQRRSILSMLPYDKAEVVHAGEDGSCFEWPCLSRMRQMAQSEDFKALYLHAKGTSYSPDTYKGEWGPFQPMLECIDAWRKLMEYWCIVKWALAVGALNAGNGTYGCLCKRLHPQWQHLPHFSGNFWWTTAADIRSRKPLTAEYMADRMNAEYWSGSSPFPKYSAFDIPALLYNLEIPESLYHKAWWHRANLSYAFRHLTHHLWKSTLII